MKAAGQIQQETQLEQVKHDHEEVFGLRQALVFRENEDGDQVANNRNTDRQIAKTQLDLQIVEVLSNHNGRQLSNDGEPSQQDHCAQPDPVAAVSFAKQAQFIFSHVRLFVTCGWIYNRYLCAKDMQRILLMMRLVAVSGSVAIAALLGGIWYATSGPSSADKFAQCRTGAVAGGAGTIGGPFELINGRGETVTDTDVITEPSLVYFGYTFCPDICPFDVARNSLAVDELAEGGRSVTPVFISIDPKRDTPEVVADFSANNHEKMIGLTGTAEQVKAASQAYRTYYKAQEAEDDYYLVDHSTFTYLVMPEEGFVEYFRREVTPEQMAEKVACFMDAK